MIGKVIAGIISVVLISFLILLITFYFLQETVKVEVNRINYQTVEIITTQGFFSGGLYEELRDTISRYGDYHIQLKLERLVNDGTYDTYYHPEEILGQPLKIGDRVSIYLEDRNSTIFASLLRSLLGTSGLDSFDQRVKSLKAGIVAKNYKEIVKGYDVIADIQQSSNVDDVAILVVTKLNHEGKFYGWQGHVDVPSTNRNYGDEDDERGNTGINYIFDNGNFTRQVDYYLNGEVRLITYIQY